MMREYRLLLKRTLMAALWSVCAFGFEAQAEDRDGPSEAEFEEVQRALKRAILTLKGLSDEERRALLPPLPRRRRGGGKLSESALKERNEVRRRVVEACRKREAKRQARSNLKWRLHKLELEEFASARALVLDTCLSWLRIEEGRPGDERTTGKCIRILGEFRAEEAAPILVEKIDIRLDKDEPASEKDVREKYPACDALIKIGKPSVQAAVDALKDLARESEKARLCTLVIAEVEGSDVGRFILKKAADAEADERRQANLRAAAKHVDEPR